MREELNFGHKPDMTTSRYSVDTDVAGMYASEGCKECYGKGYTIHETGPGKGTIRKDRPIFRHVDYCKCIRKNARKYG